MLTLDTWAQDYLRPAMLAQFGLPDTEAGNRVLDDMVEFAFKVDCDPMAVFTPEVRAELLKRQEAAIHTAGQRYCALDENCVCMTNHELCNNFLPESLMSEDAELHDAMLEDKGVMPSSFLRTPTQEEEAETRSRYEAERLRERHDQMRSQALAVAANLAGVHLEADEGSVLKTARAFFAFLSGTETQVTN